MALARAMKASITRVRRSVQISSLRKPRLCQECTFNDPAGVGLQGSALGGDASLAAQEGQSFAGLVRVVAGVQVHRDVLWWAEAQAVIETGQVFQGGFQQDRVVAVRAGHDAADGVSRRRRP